MGVAPPTDATGVMLRPGWMAMLGCNIIARLSILQVALRGGSTLTLIRAQLVLRPVLGWKKSGVFVH